MDDRYWVVLAEIVEAKIFGVLFGLRNFPAPMEFNIPCRSNRPVGSPLGMTERHEMEIRNEHDYD